MSKPAKKRAPTPPSTRSGPPQPQNAARQNPRLQQDNRWQRTKRYGWDSR